MKKVWLLVAASLVLASLEGCVAAQVPKEKLTDPGALLFNGYTRPEIGCYRCHGGEAKGGSRAPSLEKRVPKYDADKLFSIIRDGSGKMPKYGPNKATDEEIKLIVAWLQATFPAH
jgi:cytochrome c551